eukprot:TRINITY_DN8134_c0_g1_i5.p1 TRINITY_DN8134_c0_g1~~TRINITY_DN8134_c0_g1_i5.p1  ORF type:complete len:535 (-),score=105.50 TRINITY_DN8134_c0_g1_i5:116-1720(-)
MNNNNSTATEDIFVGCRIDPDAADRSKPLLLHPPAPPLLHNTTEDNNNGCSPRSNSHGSFPPTSYGSFDGDDDTGISKNDSDSSIKSATLNKLQFWAYSVGHVLNDMCAACWFTYLLVYLEDVAHLTPSQAGAVLLAGQLADAVATPLVGIFSDQTQMYWKLGSFSFGKRKLWHLGGTFMVALCFFMVFGLYSILPSIREMSIRYQITYYAVAASLFNVGWAAVQVSHMSLVPELSKVGTERVGLNSARYGFTVMSNVLVFVIFFGAIRMFRNDLKEQYLYLSCAAVIIGGGTSLFFHFGTPERRVSAGGSEAEDPAVDGLPFDWKDWIKCPKFYKVAFIYMCTRLVVNVSQVFVPFFVEYTLLMTTNGNEAITTVPLLVYISSFLGTILMKKINDRLGRRGGYILGCVSVLAAFVIFYFLTPSSSSFIYPSVILLGLGNATIMVCAVSMESDLIGINPKSAAFVFGSLSFTDKLSNGIVIYLIQNRTVVTAADIRVAISIIPAIAAVGGLVMTIFTRNIEKVTQVKRSIHEFV